MFMEKLYRRMILLVAGLGCLACSEQETKVWILLIWNPNRYPYHLIYCRWKTLYLHSM